MGEAAAMILTILGILLLLITVLLMVGLFLVLKWQKEGRKSTCQRDKLPDKDKLSDDEDL